MSFWIIVPLVSFVIAFLIGKVIKRRAHKKEAEGKWKRVLTILVIATGFFEAFSAGMNNVANAVGPLVGAGLMDATTGVIAGGLAVALGALFTRRPSY